MTQKKMAPNGRHSSHFILWVYACMSVSVALCQQHKKYSSCVTFQCWSFLTLFLNYQKLCCLHFFSFFLGCVCVCISGIVVANANLSIHETLERTRKTLHIPYFPKEEKRTEHKWRKERMICSFHLQFEDSLKLFSRSLACTYFSHHFYTFFSLQFQPTFLFEFNNWIIKMYAYIIWYFYILSHSTSIVNFDFDLIRSTLCIWLLLFWRKAKKSSESSKWKKKWRKKKLWIHQVYFIYGIS